MQQEKVIENISSLLGARKISRAALARHLGIHSQRLYRIYKGEVDMTIPELLKIAEYFGRDPGDFFKEDFSIRQGGAT